MVLHHWNRPDNLHTPLSAEADIRERRRGVWIGILEIFEFYEGFHVIFPLP